MNTSNGGYSNLSLAVFELEPALDVVTLQSVKAQLNSSVWGAAKNTP